jgi:hypothetical protein
MPSIPGREWRSSGSTSSAKKRFSEPCNILHLRRRCLWAFVEELKRKEVCAIVLELKRKESCENCRNGGTACMRSWEWRRDWPL